MLSARLPDTSKMPCNLPFFQAFVKSPAGGMIAGKLQEKKASIRAQCGQLHGKSVTCFKQPSCGNFPAFMQQGNLF